MLKGRQLILFILGIVVIIFTDYYEFGYETVSPIYRIYFPSISRYYFLIGLTLFWGLFIYIGISDDEDGEENKIRLKPEKTATTWLISIVSMLLLFFAINYVVNPHGYFSSNYFDHSYTFNATRSIKTDYFAKLNYEPEIIVLGSSIAYSISPQYIESVTGITAFNMTVNNLSPLDSLSLLKMIIAESKGEIPSLVIYQVNLPSLRVDLDSDKLGLDQSKYLNLKWKSKIYATVVGDSLSSESLIDSAYILFRKANAPGESIRTFVYLADGTRVRREISESNYLRAIAGWDGFVGERYGGCYQLDEIGKEVLNEFVKVAKLNDIRVIFYRSPFNFNDYNKSKYEIDRVLTCEKLFNELMKKITESNENVSYVDLFHEKSISKLGFQAYVDRVHLNGFGSNRVIESLLPEIETLLK